MPSTHHFGRTLNWYTSGDLREISYVLQRRLVIVQRFNSVLIHESFVSADEEPDL